MCCPEPWNWLTGALNPVYFISGHCAISARDDLRLVFGFALADARDGMNTFSIATAMLVGQRVGRESKP
jgi:hypothetical protein